VGSARHIVVGVAILVVIAALGGGLVLLGPPSEERVRRLDERRVQDLREIAQATDLYWTRHRRLPVSLVELSSDSGGYLVSHDSRANNSHDPSTNELYDYRTLDAEMYEVCGLFQGVSSAGRYGAGAGDFWSHGAGKQCFRLKVREIRQ
jgi:hypothetical protein